MNVVLLHFTHVSFFLSTLIMFTFCADILRRCGNEFKSFAKHPNLKIRLVRVRGQAGTCVRNTQYLVCVCVCVCVYCCAKVKKPRPMCGSRTSRYRSKMHGISEFVRLDFFSAAALQTQVPRVLYSFSLSHTDSSAPCIVSPSHTWTSPACMSPPLPIDFIGSQCVHACASSLGLQLLQ